MDAKARTRTAVGLAACVVALAALAWPGAASGAKWVVKGRGWGHGVGMSQYGAYGLAQHGRGYREILDHYYRHTRIGHAGSHTIKVLLGSGSDSVSFRKARKACGKRLRRRHGYRFKRSGSDVILRRARSGQDRELRPHRHRPPAAGRSGSAAKALYRGKLKAKASDGGLLVINAVGLEAYVKGVVPNEVPSSWPQAALRAQAVAARSYALATSGAGAFDVYDDTRSQVYGGKDSETERTNKAAKRTSGQVVRHRKAGGDDLLLLDLGRSDGERRVRLPRRRPGRLPEERPRPLRRSVARTTSGRPATRRTRSSRGSRGCSPAGCARSRSLKRGDSPRIVTRARGRLARELQGLRPRAPGGSGPAEHLGALPEAVARPRRALAVRIRLDRDAVIGLAHPDLVGRAAAELEALRLAPRRSTSSSRSAIEQLSVLCSGPLGSA